MSESLIHESVARQITDLSLLAEASCENFQHQVFNSRIDYLGGPSLQNIFTIPVAPNTALVITSLEIKVLYNTADAALPSDFRSTDDLNPYGPIVGGAVGTVQFLVNDIDQFAVAFDFGVINQGVLFVVTGNKTLKVAVNPHQPGGKSIVLVSRLNTFIVVPEESAVSLKKKETRIVTQ